jgi:hypothetical protein
VEVCRTLKTVLWLAFAGCIPAFGEFSPISTPTTAYTGSTTLIPITAANGTLLTSLTDGTQTIALSTAFSAQTVPSAVWAGWGSPPNTESSTPRILAYTGQMANITPITSLTLTPSLPCTTFGFEIEPDVWDFFTVSANFYSGSILIGTVSRSINGNAGALLMAASSNAPITSVVITISEDANGFAMAQFRYTKASTSPAIPTLRTAAVGALGLLLAGAGALLARAKSTAEA